MNSTIRQISTIAFAVFASTAAFAQYDLSWFTVDGGGAMLTSGGTFQLSGTIGQPDASVTPMTGGTFELVGGFWAVAGAAPCPPDIDGDGAVGQPDLGILLSAYGKCPSDAGYVAAGTLAGDPCVTQADLGVLLAMYGTACP